MRTATAVLVSILLACTPVFAQEEADRSGPRVQKFSEIERGFWVRSTIGFSMALGNMFEGDDSETPAWPPGPMLGLELGYDLGQMASLHFGIYGQQVTGSRGTTGRSDVSNDAGTLLAMLGARFNIATTKRLGWFVKASAGYMTAIPAVDTFKDGLIIHAGTGIEYATNLRHFYVGLEAGAGYSLESSAISIIFAPTLKYVF